MNLEAITNRMKCLSESFNTPHTYLLKTQFGDDFPRFFLAPRLSGLVGQVLGSDTAGAFSTFTGRNVGAARVAVAVGTILLGLLEAHLFGRIDFG